MKRIRTILLVVFSAVTALCFVMCLHSCMLHHAYKAGMPALEYADTALRGRAGVPSEGFDELWVVERPTGGEADSDEEVPGSGAMLAVRGEKEIPLPLKHTAVQAEVSGYIATVSVTQQFHNPFDEKIEAKYIFPLPQNAAVNDFIMVIGERRIRGVIREREEAQQIYLEARRQGYTASLLTQERPNIFTQSVANIEPGKAIDVVMKYFNTLAYHDGRYSFVFPTVVGPRFNPPGTSDGIGAAARGSHGITGQKTEITYLKPGERSGHDIAINVDIDAGVAIEDVTSINHAVTTKFVSKEKVSVALKPHDTVPNKDFILEYKVAGKRIKSSLLAHRDERGGFFTLMLYPPEELTSLRTAPMEMIFVLDCSGSMSGAPIEKAKTAVRRALRNLGPGDTFQIIRFSNNASQLGSTPVPATESNVRRGLSYLKSLHGSGGTMMIEGIKAALDFPHDPDRFRIVSFMTDGYIGNEADIFREIRDRLGASRIFSFGIGQSVNRYLLEGMAKIGRGAVAYVGLDESAGAKVDAFYNRVRHPALTDISIDWGGLEVSDCFPLKVQDLFVGRPVIVTGRFQGGGKTTIRITGTIPGYEEKKIELAVDLDREGVQHAGIPSIWARKQIASLTEQNIYNPDEELEQSITQLALAYNLVSSYTSFVAVDASRRTEGTEGTVVPAAVPVPEGVKYETTVEGR